MTPLYDLLTTTGSAAAIPALLLRSAADAGRRRGAAERLGQLPAWPRGRGLWLQAVSVGEVRVARTLLEAIRPIRPDLPLALSATTGAGREAARSAGADVVFSFPLDAPWIVRRALRRLQPLAFGTIETEIWPGLLRACAGRSVPAFIASGTISERSARRWGWMPKTIREALATLRVACMQSTEDADRLVGLGAPRSSVEVTGNLKFDARPSQAEGSRARLGEILGIPAGSPVLVAGSTAEGEEAIVVEAWREARRSLPALVLIVAPRHPGRFDSAARAIEAAGARVRRRSQGATGGSPGPGEAAILLDSMGELEAAYGLGRAAFVGGSLVPRGGQNPLEPARLGVPAIFGPGMESFREVAAGLVSEGAAVEVRDAQGLAREVVRLVTDEDAHGRASRAGLRFVERHRGAAARTVAALRRRIPEVFG